MPGGCIVNPRIFLCFDPDTAIDHGPFSLADWLVCWSDKPCCDAAVVSRCKVSPCCCHRLASQCRRVVVACAPARRRQRAIVFFPPICVRAMSTPQSQALPTVSSPITAGGPAPSTMRAVVVPEFGRWEYRDNVPVPEPRSGEVRIAVAACGICGTDVHIAKGDASLKALLEPPFVQGHEFCGHIDKLGEGGNRPCRGRVGQC
jgi:hypothetical protein